MKTIQSNSSTGTETWSVEEFGNRIGLGRSAAYRAAREGRIPVIRLGRRLMVPKSAARIWLETCGKGATDRG